MAYLRPILSEEIRTAITFDHMETVNEALRAVKQYLEHAVMPLNLQRLDVLRHRGSGGQSQTAITQTVIQMFREANMFEITPEELMLIVLLHTIQDKAIMVKVQ